MEKRSKGSNGVRDRSDWERKEKRREGVRWKKRTQGTGGVEGREGGDTGRNFIVCTGFASHGMICNLRYQSHPTFCLACTTALQKSCACRWWHSSHIWL